MNNLKKVDELSNRLKNIMKIRNIKSVELSSKTGIDKSQISHYLKGDYKAKQDTLYLMANALNVNPVWLMGYDVPMERNFESNVFPIDDVAVKLPVLGRISAGLPILATENIIDYAFAPSSKLKKDYNYFYLVVQGDSMNLKFNDGDFVLVQKQDYLDPEQIGVFLIDGQDATVKKFRGQNGNIIILDPMSSNPIHITQIYDMKQIPVKIIGKIISYQGNI